MIIGVAGELKIQSPSKGSPAHSFDASSCDAYASVPTHNNSYAGNRLGAAISHALDILFDLVFVHTLPKTLPAIIFQI